MSLSYYVELHSLELLTNKREVGTVVKLIVLIRSSKVTEI